MCDPSMLLGGLGGSLLPKNVKEGIDKGLRKTVGGRIAEETGILEKDKYKKKKQQKQAAAASTGTTTQSVLGGNAPQAGTII